MILSVAGLEPSCEVWCALLLTANRAETRRLRKLLWWNMLRESSFEDGRTFIRGFFEERSMPLSLDKLTELDVIVDDDEGCVWVTIIFGTAAAFSADVGVGVRDSSGVGDLVRQFFSHKSGVIKFSKKRHGIQKHKLIYDRLRVSSGKVW